ncbi:MAG: mechanosensitive ion channel family protein [Burkholderiales bacterium]
MNQLLNIVGAAGQEAWSVFLRPALSILIILVLAWAASHLADRVIRLLRNTASGRVQRAEAMRIETLGRVLHYVVSVVVWIVAGMLVLSEIGISIAPILGAAGIAGIAVGFGAQSLVKDYFTGIVLLLENQVRVGDVIEAGGIGGLVEEVTLRYIRLRDYDGNVHFVPNGIIAHITSRSREYAQSVIDVGVAYREDVDAVLEVMREVGAQMRADPVFGPRIMEDIEMVGVERWDESAVILRCRFKVMPLEQWNTRREYLRRLKKTFDEKGIEIPYPHLTVYAGSAPGRAPLEVALLGQAQR